jgi:hypothetical protein
LVLVTHMGLILKLYLGFIDSKGCIDFVDICTISG